VTQEELRSRVEEVLSRIRPVIEAHRGQVELVGVSEDGVVEVRLQGACRGCPLAELTLRLGIEQVLKEEIPAVAEVRAVD
jgi:Fe-S cluster biogenesis protein NfuA